MPSYDADPVASQSTLLCFFIISPPWQSPSPASSLFLFPPSIKYLRTEQEQLDCNCVVVSSFCISSRAQRAQTESDTLASETGSARHRGSQRSESKQGLRFGHLEWQCGQWYHVKLHMVGAGEQEAVSGSMFWSWLGVREGRILLCYQSVGFYM